MLNSKLIVCSEGDSISVLLDKINCKLVKLGATLYGNTVYMLNNYVSAIDMFDLLMYKRILTFRQVNPDYCTGVYGELVGDTVQWNQSNLIYRDYYIPWFYRIIRDGISSDTLYADLIPTKSIITTISVSNTTINGFQLIIYLSDGTELLNEYIDGSGFLNLTIGKPINSLMGINVTSPSWNAAVINLSLTIENPF